MCRMTHHSNRLSTYGMKLRSKLGLRRKLKKTDWPIIYSHYLKGEERERGIYLNGLRIPWDKAWKEIRRSGALTTYQGNPHQIFTLSL